MYSHIERHLQLHEHIEIIYVVDGYEAQFYSERLSAPLITAVELDIKTALSILDKKLASFRFEDRLL